MTTRVFRLRLIIIALVVLYGVFQLWKEVLEDRLIPKRWGVVEEDSIYRSGQLHQALVRSMLEDNGIDVIINMNRPAPDKIDHATEDSVADELGIEKYRFSMNGDGTGDAEQYVQALNRLHLSVLDGQRVLVHCTAGSQRTGAVIGLYRVLFQSRAADATVREMASYALDPVDDEDLLDFMNNNMKYMTRRLVELGALTEVPEPLPRFRGGDQFEES